MVLSEMMKVGPWCRLPLTLRWLEDEFGRSYLEHVTPPMHMPITFGKVISQKVKNGKKNRGENKEVKEVPADIDISLCALCELSVDCEDGIMCIKPGCLLFSHLTCLAEYFKKDDMILPIEGTCPVCKTSVLWGDLIRKKIGCDLHLQENDVQSDSSDD